MRPSGPRVRSNDPRQQRQPVSSSASSSSGARHPPSRGGPQADRDQVFASIFGRPAGGHHTPTTTPSHPSPVQQGYNYSPNPTPVHAYSQQQFVTPNHGAYPQPGRQPISNVGYEAFAPPLPPPPPPSNGMPGQMPASLGGPRERPIMRNGTDFDRDQAYNPYRYGEVSPAVIHASLLY
jgi:hypothetical protein